MSRVWQRWGAMEIFRIHWESYAGTITLKTVQRGHTQSASNFTPEFMVTRRTVTQRQIQLFTTTENCKHPQIPTVE